MSDTAPGAREVIVYADKDFGGHYAKRDASSYQGNCNGDNLGKCSSAMPCADDVPSKCWSFNDSISSIKVGPGTIYKGYSDRDYNGKELQLNGGETGTSINIPTGNPWFNDTISSWKLFKDCSNPNWIWDQDCQDRKSNTINNADQEIVRAEKCGKANLSTDSNCRSWCFNSLNMPKCQASMNSYCSSNPLESKCKEWGRSSDNKALLDNIMVDYCKNNPTNNIECACFEENARRGLTAAEQDVFYGGSGSSGSNNRAICWSRKCGENGYWTESMKDALKTCPKCYQVLTDNKPNISQVTNSSVVVTSMQSCTVSDSTSSNNPPAGPSTTPSTSTAPTIISGYMFHQGNNIDGSDIKKVEGTINDVAIACSADSACGGFNTDGYLKFKQTNLVQKGEYAANNQGVYTKDNWPSTEPPPATATIPVTTANIINGIMHTKFLDVEITYWLIVAGLILFICTIGLIIPSKPKVYRYPFSYNNENLRSV